VTLSCVSLKAPSIGLARGAVRGQPEQIKARRSRQPWRHRLCFVDAIVIRHQVDPVLARRRITTLERVEQIPKERVGFALSATEMDHSGAHIPSSGQLRLLVLAGREHFHWPTLPHPLTARLGQQGNVEFVDKHEGLPRPERFDSKTKGGQFGGPFGIVLLGHEFGAFPRPAEKMPPAPHRFRRHAQPRPGFPTQGQPGTTPARAAPAVSHRRFRQQRQPTTTQRRSQEQRRIALCGLLLLSRPPALPPDSGPFLERGAGTQPPIRDLRRRTVLGQEQTNRQTQKGTEQAQLSPLLA
jgi:hypothetical protein